MCLQCKPKELTKASGDFNSANSAHLPSAPGRCGFPLTVSGIWLVILKMIKKGSGQPWERQIEKRKEEKIIFSK